MGAQIIPSFKSRSVLWAVMTIAASLMILGKLIPFSITLQIDINQTSQYLSNKLSSHIITPVSIFTDQWLIGPTSQLQGPFGDYHNFSLSRPCYFQK